ncbi:MAG: hypothetical protein J6331_08475, partial [Lentisphaeria bacterium]|nr:hypothetical protein [Lentisphaeria bacterium]
MERRQIQGKRPEDHSEEEVKEILFFPQKTPVPAGPAFFCGKGLKLEVASLKRETQSEKTPESLKLEVSSLKKGTQSEKTPESLKLEVSSLKRGDAERKNT